MKLSKTERIILINQHIIMQNLYPNESDSNEKAIDILSNGYEYLYDELYQYVYDGNDVMSEDECKEVWETLSMFDSIDRTINSLGLTHDSEKVTKFFGYDGNNEGKFMGFAEFTMTKEGRFSGLPLDKDNYFNSHSPARGVYRRMLDAWNKIDASARYPMSQENLDYVLAATAHSPNK